MSNEIGQSGLSSISDVLEHNSSLTSLCLSRTIVFVLLFNDHYDLWGCKISESGASSLSSVLFCNSSLTELILKGDAVLLKKHFFSILWQ